jgi:Lrp/AsnC family leucine-responsive transcriptional regulator|tara:strand:- start:2289 stop:2768 length:480 start_codon:yes stop_codon:yes gene_type:complete
MSDLSENDRKILSLIQRDAKLTNAEIGRQVGLSVSAVNERLHKLRDSGVIRAYEARLAPAKVGMDLCAFVLVQLERPEHEAPFKKAVRSSLAVQECHHVTGDYNYLLKIRTASTAELEEILTQGLKSLTGVVRTSTMIALSSPKESTALDLKPRDLPAG